MTATHIITILGILVSAIVAIIIASQQRKQMRQIELYKQDPSVGLIPPSSALTRFVKSNWDAVLGFGGPVVSLIIQFSTTTTLTEWSVLVISLNVALIVANFVLAITFRLLDRLARLLSDLTSVTKEHFEITKAHTRLLQRAFNFQPGGDGT